MLYKYPCGCVGLAPDDNADGPLIVMACDSEDDSLPSNLSRIVAYRRRMNDPEQRKPLSVEAFKCYLEAVGELKSLACLGQEFISLTQASNRITERRKKS